MKIDIPPHGVELLASEIAHHRREMNRAQGDREFALMETHERVLAGAKLVLRWLGPRQQRAFERAVWRAYDEEENDDA